MMEERYFTIEEVAEKLAVAKKTVKNWLLTGKLQGIKLTNKLWRIPESELNRFIEEAKARAFKKEG